MSASLSGTKTRRVVGFLKGLFGRGATDSANVHEEAAYDYTQELPVTGAQLKAPVPAARPGANIAKATAVQNGDERNANVPVPVAQPVAGHGGNINGFTITAQSSGHVNGVALASNGASPKPAAPPTFTPPAPIPVAIKTTNGNVTHAPAAPAPKPVSTPAGKSIELSLATVVAALPSDLQARIVKKDFGDRTVAVSLEAVLAQLPTGVVQIPFAAIRASAAHLFSTAADADQTMVALPLGEVLRQVNPAQFAKPENQKRITADAEIASPFADKGSNLNLQVNGPPVARTVTPAPSTPPSPRHGLSEVAKPVPPTANVTPPMRIKVPTTPAANPSPTPTAFVTPVTPPAKTAPIAMPKTQPAIPSPLPPNGAPVTPKAQATSVSPIPVPKALTQTSAPAPAPVAPPTPRISGVPSLRMDPASTMPAPVQAPVQTPASVATKPAPNQTTLTVSLKSLVDTWPDAVKKEVHEQNLLNGSVDLPLDTVAAQLKNGRVTFPWDQIRSWISPRPAAESSHGAVELELPLKVIAPLFLGLKSTDSTKAQRLTADERIPDVFALTAKPVAPPTPAATQAVASPVPEPAGVVPPTAMSPEAVVKRAASLQGVAGALVALPDGLVVASKLPPGLNADSLAAFLPQIYAKFDACLNDLSMDGLNNLNFTAGNVPWRVYRSSSVYFAAFGRANEPLPGDWLGTLAAELEKKG